MSGASLSPYIRERLRKISLRQLVYFLELSREGSFSQAAKSLRISQPTLSQQIAQLEATLEIRLFQRTGRMLRLTDAGKRLIRRLPRILSTLGDTMESIKQSDEGAILRVGLPSYMSYPVVRDTLKRFRDRFPDVRLFLAELSATEMCLMLNERTIDAAFMTYPTPSFLDAGMESISIWKQPYQICVSRSHPIAARPHLTTEDVTDLDFILVPRDYHREHYDYQIEMLRKFGISPRIMHTEVSTTSSQMTLASAGLGGCLLSQGTVSLPGDLVLRETKPALGPHELALFWPIDNASPYLTSFCNCAMPV